MSTTSGASFLDKNSLEEDDRLEIQSLLNDIDSSLSNLATLSQQRTGTKRPAPGKNYKKTLKADIETLTKLIRGWRTRRSTSGTATLFEVASSSDFRLKLRHLHRFLASCGDLIGDADSLVELDTLAGELVESMSANFPPWKTPGQWKPSKTQTEEANSRTLGDFDDDDDLLGDVPSPRTAAKMEEEGRLPGQQQHSEEDADQDADQVAETKCEWDSTNVVICVDECFSPDEIKERDARYEKLYKGAWTQRDTVSVDKKYAGESDDESENNGNRERDDESNEYGPGPENRSSDNVVHGQPTGLAMGRSVIGPDVDEEPEAVHTDNE